MLSDTAAVERKEARFWFFSLWRCCGAFKAC